jgi:hypothetical protein
LSTPSNLRKNGTLSSQRKTRMTTKKRNEIKCLTLRFQVI